MLSASKRGSRCGKVGRLSSLAVEDRAKRHARIKKLKAAALRLNHKAYIIFNRLEIGFEAG
jgi:hypothetical protein